MPEHLLVGWLERVGDSVPFHTPHGRVTGEEALAGVIRRPLRSVVDQLTDPAPDAVDVAVVVPAEWSAHRSAVVRRTVGDEVEAALHEALGEVVDIDVRPVREIEAVDELVRQETQGPGAPVLVIDTGSSATRAVVVDPASRTGAGPLVVDGSVGGDTLDDRVFRHVLTQIPPDLLAERGSDESLQELVRLKRACRSAREELSTTTETEVAVRLTSAGSQVRLVRPELEDLIEPDLLKVLEVGHRAVEGWSEQRADDAPEGLAPTPPVGQVLLLGGAARTPRLVQLSSATWAVPVHRPREPELALLTGAAGVLQARAAVADVTGPDPDATDRIPVAGRPVESATVGALDEARDSAVPALVLAGSQGGAHATARSLGGPSRAHIALGAAAAALVVAGAGTAMAVLPGLLEPDGSANATQVVTRTSTVTLEPGGARVAGDDGAQTDGPSGRAGEEADVQAALADGGLTGGSTRSESERSESSAARGGTPGRSPGAGSATQQDGSTRPWSASGSGSTSAGSQDPAETVLSTPGGESTGGGSQLGTTAAEPTGSSTPASTTTPATTSAPSNPSTGDPAPEPTPDPTSDPAPDPTSDPAPDPEPPTTTQAEPPAAEEPPADPAPSTGG